MGGCATKPEAVKEQGEAPLPLEETAEVSGSKVEGAAEDEGKRTSLGHLFRESEKRREASENEDITVKETITTSQEETMGEEEEQTKVQVHPAPNSETATQAVETKEVSAPTHEETPVPSSVATSEAHVEEEKPVEVVNLKEIAEDSTSEAHVEEEKPMEVVNLKEIAEDSSSVAVEQKAEVVEEKRESELEASSATEKEDDAALPSSTTETA